MQLAIRALAKFGPDSAEALPILLQDHLSTSYTEEYRSLAFQAILKIDPDGTKTLTLTEKNSEDANRVRSTVELLEFIGSPNALEVARKTRERWRTL